MYAMAGARDSVIMVTNLPFFEKNMGGFAN
jgi:hypothetical protein